MYENKAFCSKVDYGFISWGFFSNFFVKRGPGQKIVLHYMGYCNICYSAQDRVGVEVGTCNVNALSVTFANNDNFDELFPVFCVSSAAWELFQCKQGMSIIPDHWLPRRWHPVIWTLKNVATDVVEKVVMKKRGVQTFGFLPLYLSIYLDR